jgi:predicted CXXCH cytochrome family protein
MELGIYFELVKKMRFRILWLFIFSMFIVFYPFSGYTYVGSHKNVLTCNDCHTAYPMGIRTAEGNVNLCLSCHTGGATASNLALYSVDQATITSGGVYGKSHRWDALAFQVDVATVSQASEQVTIIKGSLGEQTFTKWYPYGTGAKWFKDTQGKYRIACSSCHNSKTALFIRNEKERDEKLCADCHTYDFQMSTTTARTYTAKKCNHPVKTIGSNYVGCSSCHTIHAK